MFAEKTVIVLGAGASYEAELPTGYELVDDIKEYLENPQFREDTRYAHKWFPDALDSYKGTAIDAGKQIVKGLPASFSIDNYIDSNRHIIPIEGVGKLAIVKTILAAERKSLLKGNRYEGPNLFDVRGTWYTKCSALLFEGCTIHDLPHRLRQITFIIFNYDRCLEFYLFWAIRHTYKQTNEQAAELMKNVMIHHPYGSVGGLPFMSDQEVDFGLDVADPDTSWKLARGIKTFTQGVNDLEKMSYRSAIWSAQMVIFLGFAFHSMNLRLLEQVAPTRGVPTEPKSFYGTVLGKSDSDVGILVDRISHMCSASGSDRAILTRTTCTKLFDEFAATFAMDRN